MSNKTKIIVFFSIIVLGSALFFWKSDWDITNYPPKGSLTVAFGDSLVEGVGAEAGKDLFSQVSERSNINILNFGKSGDTTTSALGRIDEALYTSPDIVFVLLGGNDALRRIPLSETRNNLEEIITKFQNTGAVVVLLGVRGGLLGDPYKDMYEDIAKETGSIYVSDVLDGVFGNPKYMYDSIHPNTSGYSIIADRLSETLNKVLKDI